MDILFAMTSKIKPGDKFERLTVIKLVRKLKGPGIRGVYPVFECQCSCGAIKNIFSYDLTRRHVKSCGCLGKERLKIGQAKIKALNESKRLLGFHPENHLFYYYKINASRRLLDFKLTPEDFKNLIYLPCWYCGKERVNSQFRHGLKYSYNGLDRLDSYRGYSPDNVVPCCKFCNRMKGKFHGGDFLRNVKNVFKHSMPGRVISSKDELLNWVKETKKHGKLAVSSGCFDVFHHGHARSLEESSKLGDSLLVGINNDNSVRAIKGKNRPINNETNRAKTISCLRFVDAVYIFDDTVDFLKLTQPNIWTKGEDYNIQSINQEELKAVTDAGGEIKFIPMVDGLSTTSILLKI